MDESIRDVLVEAAKLIEEPPKDAPAFTPSVIPAQMVTTLARGGHISPEEARRMLNSSGIVIFGGVKSLDEARAALEELAAQP